MPRAWILQANPSKWDVWAWWENSSEELDDWTIAKHIHDVDVGDDFALWISGADAGVYAIGTVVGPPRGPLRPGGGFWVHPPERDAWAIDVEATAYLFENPILKHDLVQDPDFADALIIRMPGSANPIPLEPQQWQAIATRVRGNAPAHKPTDGTPIVTARPLGHAPEDITVATSAQEAKRTFREARLVKRYEKHVGRPLMSRAVKLPSGERLVCDAYDDAEGVLIEAKASSSRQDIRMAIGQLLDYRRHLAPDADLAVLLPAIPGEDLVALLNELDIRIIARSGRGFVTK